MPNALRTDTPTGLRRLSLVLRQLVRPSSAPCSRLNARHPRPVTVYGAAGGVLIRENRRAAVPASPAGPIRPLDEGGRFAAPGHLHLLRVPGDLAAQSQGEVGNQHGLRQLGGEPVEAAEGRRPAPARRQPLLVV